MKINTAKLDCRLSDKSSGSFILDIMKFNAKVGVMTALADLKLATRRAREEMEEIDRQDDSTSPFFVDDSQQI
jgi:hypothetical protein